MTLKSITSVKIQELSTANDYHSRVELDRHSDTCVIGKNAMVIHDHRRRVSVTGYDPKAGSNLYRIVSAAQTGETSLLIINQAIEIPHLRNHLLCIFQCRMSSQSLMT